MVSDAGILNSATDKPVILFLIAEQTPDNLLPMYWWGNNPEPYTSFSEAIILEKMINEPGKTFSREAIGKLIDLDKERSIDVIITRLRKKIEIDPKNPKYLQTLRVAGYVLWIE
mgnify:CR=1 FL=1